MKSFTHTQTHTHTHIYIYMSEHLGWWVRVLLGAPFIRPCTTSEQIPRKLLYIYIYIYTIFIKYFVFIARSHHVSVLCLVLFLSLSLSLSLSLFIYIYIYIYMLVCVTLSFSLLPHCLTLNEIVIFLPLARSELSRNLNSCRGTFCMLTATAPNSAP